MKRFNKRGEGGIFGLIFFIIIFMIMFMYALSPTASVSSDAIIEGSHPVGIYGFFMAHLNIWIFLVFIAIIFYKGAFG